MTRTDVLEEGNLQKVTATAADTDLPEIASFSNDFYPDEKLSRKMQENFDQLRDYRRERIERINAGNSSWSSHA